MSQPKSRQAAAEPRNCALSGRSIKSSDATPAELIHEPLLGFVRQRYPGWDGQGVVDSRLLRELRYDLVTTMLQADRGELRELDREVLASLRAEANLARDISSDYSEQLSFGDRLADQIAAFGGSWKFIIIFFLVLLVWILLNTSQLLARPFDPFPFILMNLVLSCIAALQAPVIMMSQNRQEAKDRLRSENDYQVNLKAEIEVRTINAKLDLLLTHQWQRLLELQQLQLEMMEELSGRKKNA